MSVNIRSAIEPMELERNSPPRLFPRGSYWRSLLVDYNNWNRDPNSSKWVYSTKGKLVMAGILIAFAIVVSIIDMFLLSKYNRLIENNKQASWYCESFTCLKQANDLILRMNKTIDPCDDFYEFACGSYLKQIPIPRRGIIVEPTDSIEDLVYSQLRYQIEQPILQTDIQPYAMVKTMYSTCMDTETIDRYGFHQMELLLRELGGWPMLEEHAWEEIDWIDITERLRQYGLDTNQFLKIDIQLNNESEYFITIDQPYDKYYKFDLNYEDFAYNIAEKFGARVWFIQNEVDAVVEFRRSLSKFVATRSKSYNMITINELELKYPSIRWLDVLNAALALPNVTLTNQESVGVRSFEYISEFIKTIKQTPNRVQVNHALIDIIRSRIAFLPNDVQKIEQEYYHGGVAPQRWKTCLLMVLENFREAMDALYIRTYRNDDDKEEVTEMASDIKNTFIRELKEVQWMDEETKEIATEKFNMTSAHIGYPVELQDKINVIQFYEDLTLDSKFILHQVNQISKFKRDKLLNLYMNPALRRSWESPLESFFASKYYSDEENSIYIPLAIMQYEYFTLDRPISMNYGGIGFVIAHALAGGFDSSVSHLPAFDEKSGCLVEQYNNYSLPGSNTAVDGNRTLSKNIEDNFGAKAAYLAYLDWIGKNEKQPTLPGLNYSDKQLFWLFLASSRCSKHNEEYYHNYAPNRFRVLGPLSNSQEFAKDFNCPLGSNMNPIKKCELW